MRNANRNLFLPIAVLMSVMTAAPCVAADAPAPQVIEEIQELDEIWVRGKHLSKVIEAAEDDFFKLYNKLSKDQNYDVYCGTMALNSRSMIMIRKCVPGFIVNNSYNFLTNTVSLGSSCESYGVDAAYSCGASGLGVRPVPQYVPPSLDLLRISHGPAYARNIMKVVTGDPRLLEMVGGLRNLYDEMELTQKHFVKVKASAEPSRPARKRVRPYTNPRSH